MTTDTREESKEDRERRLRLEKIVDPTLNGNPDLSLQGPHMVYVGKREGEGEEGAPPINTFG